MNTNPIILSIRPQYFCLIRAEDHKDETYAANVTAIQNIIQNCRDLQIPLLHMSTDYVFSGNDPPYSEDSLRDPVNYYGQTKVEAEDALENSDIEYLICRTTMLYGTKQPYQRPNPFIDWYERFPKIRVSKALRIIIRTPRLWKIWQIVWFI